jgi:hypothetical protein
MTRQQRRAQARTKPRPEQHAHELVASVAQGIMHEIYDQFMQDNKGYREWRDQNPDLNSKQLEDLYVATRWGLAIPAARAALTMRMQQTLDESEKDTIMEALVLDATLRRGRGPGWLQEAVLPSNGMPTMPVLDARKLIEQS